ncbi:nuclear transport factor 2 family protein [Actinomadura scrupuli]|uniref:nuclear transport factor 2 family protein n=1 Tax=Actinomadura scrupuli TaxID=559629 RepID=UPI003D96828B
MTTTTAADTARLQELSDRADLNDLLARQGLWLDERRFDETASIFTEDATVETPGGRAKGLQALAEQAHRNHSRYAATQHVTTNVLIDLDGDRATVRANLIVTFVRDAATPEPTLTMGERYRFEAARTRHGWRFSRVKATPVWRAGELPQKNKAHAPSTS